MRERQREKERERERKRDTTERERAREMFERVIEGCSEHALPHDLSSRGSRLNGKAEWKYDLLEI